jgi:hypothetical protein
MTTVALPPSIEYGKIVGQLTMTTLDGNDADEKPDGKGVEGTVTLAPLDGQGRTVDDVFVFFRAFVVPLSNEGVITTRNGQPGVWLPVGMWRATFNLKDGITMPPRDFEVTTLHTALAPLNIMRDAPAIGPVLTPGQYLTLALRMSELEMGVAALEALSTVIDGGDPMTVYTPGLEADGGTP